MQVPCRFAECGDEQEAADGPGCPGQEAQGGGGQPVLLTQTVEAHHGQQDEQGVRVAHDHDEGGGHEIDEPGCCPRRPRIAELRSHQEVEGGGGPEAADVGDEDGGSVGRQEGHVVESTGHRRKEREEPQSLGAHGVIAVGGQVGDQPASHATRPSWAVARARGSRIEKWSTSNLAMASAARTMALPANQGSQDADAASRRAFRAPPRVRSVAVFVSKVSARLVPDRAARAAVPPGCGRGHPTKGRSSVPGPGEVRVTSPAHGWARSRGRRVVRSDRLQGC